MSAAARNAVFNALADASRRTLLERLLACNGQTLTELGSGLEITRQAVTKHIRVLERADLIVTRKRGRERLHFINPVPINAVAMRWLGPFGAVPLEVLAAPLPEDPAE